MKRSIIVIAGTLAGIALLAQTAFAVVLPVRAYGNDTVAGYSSLLKSSVLQAGKSVVFVVERPDKSIVRVPAEADSDGIARAELYGLQTKLAGEYYVALVYPGSSDASQQSSFLVHPDAVSVTQSTIRVSNALVPADKSATLITVTLYDAYRNSIQGHAIKLISSRLDDHIEIIDRGVTAQDGKANFKVSSSYPGFSIFSAIDVTVNQILSSRAEVVFQEPMGKKSIGGNLLNANLLGADIGQGSAEAIAGPVQHFEIESLPSTVRVNEELTFTVVAKDQNDNAAKNYTGTVLFAVPNDERAVLPGNGEYTFKEANQGRFTFNLALRFSALGKQTLQVFDKDNWDIKGEAETEVVSESAVTPAQTGSALSIKSPPDGSELGSNFVIITGQGDPNINLKVFDRDSKIGDSETDSEGFFSFEARALESGSHTFYVMSDKNEVSNSVAITIDTLPPVLNQLSVFPEGILEPGQSLQVIVQSEPNLETAKVRLQGAETALSVGSDPGVYETNLVAPGQAGEFSIDIILVDRLANKAELLAQRKIQVQLSKVSAPQKVQGLSGTAGDGKVNLTWQAGAEDSGQPVYRYRVYYGTNFQKLGQTLDTNDASTAITVGNLTNNTQYFFGVKAVDNRGTESEGMSTVIAITPALPVAQQPINPISIASGQYQSIALDSAAQISWPVNPSAFRYKVYFGLKSGRYDDFMVVQSNYTNITVPDLINGLTYYFAVAAMDSAGMEISALSPEFSVTPNTAGLYSAASSAPYSQLSAQLNRIPKTESTGPETFWVAFGALALAQFFYFKKRRLLKR